MNAASLCSSISYSFMPVYGANAMQMSKLWWQRSRKTGCVCVCMRVRSFFYFHFSFPFPSLSPRFDPEITPKASFVELLLHDDIST